MLSVIEMVLAIEERHPDNVAPETFHSMPKLIVDRPNNRKRKVPPCGRLINYVEPRSPFQKLIDSRKRELRISGRGLAKEIGVSQATLWIWLHNENGFPHPKAFKPDHLAKLAKVLQLPASDIQQAIDASRMVYSPQEVQMPLETKDAFRRYIEVLQNDRRQVVALSYVINLARTMYNGATGEKV